MKIVSSKEMVRIEKLAFKMRGEHKAERYMEEVGKKISDQIERLWSKEKYFNEKRVYLLCGKGNNAGDAYVCGRFLKQKGFEVYAYQVRSETYSELCAKKKLEFEELDGKVIEYDGLSAPSFLSGGLIVDGLFGTGLNQSLGSIYKELIYEANCSGLLICSIDIPSGLSGDHGCDFGSVKDAKKELIHADITFFLGLPKVGFFLGQAWNFVGELIPIDFGLETTFIDEAKAEGELSLLSDAAEILPALSRNEHKYQSGSVSAWMGSPGMSGAAALASLAAMRSGCGVLKLVHNEELRLELAGRVPKEVVCHSFTNEQMKDGNEEEFLGVLANAKACLIGPGLGSQVFDSGILQQLANKISGPLLLDADGLNAFAKKPFKLPDQVVMTPHLGEMKSLLKLTEPLSLYDEHLTLCKEFSKKNRVTLVLKGAPTFIFHRGEEAVIVGRGHPGMATAGSGDVLSGIISAFLAKGLNPLQASILGVNLHGLAGELAAKDLGGYSLIASDIISYLPAAFLKLNEIGYH